MKKKDKKEEIINEEEVKNDLEEFLPKHKNSLGIIAFILSIIKVILTFIKIPEISYITGIIVLIISIIALVKQYKKTLPILAIIISSLSMIWVSIKCEYFDYITNYIENKQVKTVKETGKFEARDIDKYLKFTIGKFKVTKDEYDIVSTYLTIKIKNTSDKTLSGSITVRVKDKDGKVFDHDATSFYNLKKGKTTEVKVFTRVEEDKIELYKTGNYEVREVSIF